MKWHKGNGSKSFKKPKSRPNDPCGSKRRSSRTQPPFPQSFLHSAELTALTANGTTFGRRGGPRPAAVRQSQGVTAPGLGGLGGVDWALYSSFAYVTIRDRLPVILTKVVDGLHRDRHELVRDYGEVPRPCTQEGEP